MSTYFRQPIQTADERITQPKALDINNMRKRLEIKGRQKTPLTTAGFDGIVTEKTVENNQEKIRFGHAAGPIPKSTQTQLEMSWMHPEKLYQDDVVMNWMPYLSLSVYDEDLARPLTAAEIDTKMNQNRWIPHYFVNPMQDLDYIVIEALSRFTFIGPLMDGLTKFIMGTGFKPELELINPTNDFDKDKETISEGQEIIESLTQIDNQINQSSEEFIDTSFTEKISALIGTANIYNRSALMFGYDTPISINGKPYKQIPSSIKFAHARDIGIVDADPGTWRLKAVQWRNAYNMVPSTDMIYLWNPLISSKTRSSWLYGDSMVMPMIDAARVIRKNIGVNFNAMAEATWAGMFVLAVKPNGQSTQDKQNEYQQIVQNMVRGGPNVLMEDPKDVSFNSVDFNPKVAEFITMNESLLKYSIACIGMPHSMFYDEDSSNRATMIGKIQLAKSIVIEPLRNAYGRDISNQWYQRWFRLLYKESKPKLYNKYKIKIRFNDLNIEEWFDKIQAVNMLDSRKQLTDEAYGDLIGQINYKNMVEQDAQTNPGGSAGNKMKIGSGDGFEITKNQDTAENKAVAARRRKK